VGKREFYCMCCSSIGIKELKDEMVRCKREGITKVPCVCLDCMQTQGIDNIVSTLKASGLRLTKKEEESL
jgi:hypothetical protein